MMIWKKPMIMTIIISALLIIIPISVNAAESTIKKTAEFTSESTSPKYDKFEKKINSNGSSYELDDVSVEKIGEEKKTQLQDKTTTQTKSNLSSKSIQIGSTENITVDGKSYVGKVTDVVYQDNTKINRTGEVNGSEDYGLRVDKPTPPSTKSLPYYDAETGQNMNINAPMTELKKTSEQWQKYTYINITVSNYTDTQFMFNNKKINHNGSTVLGSDYYSELIGMAGLSGSNYRVSSVYWTGDSYKNGNTRYRNARADIQAYSCSYKALYYKKFSLPDINSYNATVTYSYSQENVLKTIYKYKATAVYKLSDNSTGQTEQEQETKIQDNNQKQTNQKQEISVKTITTISLILVLSLAFVILIFFLLTRLKTKDSALSKVLNRKRRK